MDAPRLRTDLVAKQVEEAGHQFVDVTDPGNGTTFRFYEAEYFIATAMNGTRDLSGLASWAQSELGLAASTDELQQVIGKLSELGYLDTMPPPIDDLSLGQAGGSSLADKLPAPAPLELGSAGNAKVENADEATFVAPDLSLGKAGNVGPLDFGGVDDDEPTKVKGNPLSGRPSDPSIPPRPPTSQPPTPSLTPMRSGSGDEDGPTHLPPPATDFDDEMSVDLSDHMQLGPDAVKEAVRQSQMMSAVDPSQIDALKTPPPPPSPTAVDAQKPAEAKSGIEPTELPSKPPTGQPSTSPLLTDKPATTGKSSEPSNKPSVGKPPVGKPIDLDNTAKPVGPTPGPDEKKSKVGTIVVLLLVLIALFAVAVALNLFNLRSTLGLDSKDDTKTAAPIKKPIKKPIDKPEPPPPPKKPKLPAAKLAAADGPGVDIKAAAKGTLASIVASGTKVEADAEVARLNGGERYVKNIANVKLRLDHYRGKLEKATANQKKAEAAGDANGAKRLQKDVKKAQAKVDEKLKRIAADEAKLAAFLIKAPAAGTFETSLKAGSRVEADAIVATIKGEPVLNAVFTLPDDKKLSKGEEVEVVSKTDDKKRLGCQVTAIDGKKATVECPTDEGLGPGADVVLP